MKSWHMSNVYKTDGVRANYAKFIKGVYEMDGVIAQYKNWQ